MWLVVMVSVQETALWVVKVPGLTLAVSMAAELGGDLVCWKRWPPCCQDSIEEPQGLLEAEVEEALGQKLEWASLKQCHWPSLQPASSRRMRG